MLISMLWGKTYTLFLELSFSFTKLVEIEKLNVKANGNPCHVPHMANAMPIHMIKTALYSIIIQFDEETIQLT